MKRFEIPYVYERGKRYRFFEMVPGLLTWFMLFLPFILTQISNTVATFFIIGYLMLWFAKSIGLDIRALQGFRLMTLHQKLPWNEMLAQVHTGDTSPISNLVPRWHADNLARVAENPSSVKADEIVHAIIIATYNESREVLEPTIQSVLAQQFDMKKVILVLAFEERGGEIVEQQATALIAEYKGKFLDAIAVKHPKDIPGEVIGKGGNITYAGRELQKLVERRGLNPLEVIVTTLDADNRPHPYYLSALAYIYAVCPDPLHVSFQPIPMFTNNIWDAPAPMRVIATGNSFWNIVLSVRPHMLRNFSSHAQTLQTLIDTDFWSVRTIVEDGHQFWRTYFRYDGKHEVFPLYIPIYQDAVLSSSYFRTLKAQFVQLRRWAWGASDVAYVAEMGFFRKNKVPRGDLIMKFLRLLEGHITWAVAPLILAFSAFVPAFFHPKDYAANQLPHIVSQIQTIALAGVVFTLFLSVKTLPPKPLRYRRHRSLFMILQWVFLPLTTVVYNSLSALYSQTRLMFGWYIGKFDVTDKAVITDDKRKVM